MEKIFQKLKRYLEAWKFATETEIGKSFSNQLYLYNEAEARYRGKNNSNSFYFEELRGIAAGAEIDFERIWVTVAQQELLGACYLADDGRSRGCSDTVLPDMILHNEDGDKGLIGYY